MNADLNRIDEHNVHVYFQQENSYTVEDYKSHGT